jgi:hypothetical protein
MRFDPKRLFSADSSSMVGGTIACRVVWHRADEDRVNAQGNARCRLPREICGEIE